MHRYIILLLWNIKTCFSSKRFCNENKTVLGSGDTLKYPQLAESLKVIAEQGADAFYTGKIGQDLIEDIKAEGWYKPEISRNTCVCECCDQE